MYKYLPLVEKYVKDSFSKDGRLSSRGYHSLKTLEWLLVICPFADESMQIAAIAHDIDSAFIKYNFSGGFKDPIYLEKHQDGAADVIGKFLESNNANEDLVNIVKHLVSKHEVGGDDEQNIIKDADSLGFFDRDMASFIARHSKKGASHDEIREKIDWMYERITTKQAKEIAKPMYDKAVKVLQGK